jgi:hypothetical protein
MMEEHVTKAITNLKVTPVADAAGPNVTAEEFNALLTAMRNAGLLLQ